MTGDDALLGWGIVGIGVLLAAIFAIVGIIGLARKSFALKSRLEAYAELPILARIARMRETLPVTIANVATAPELITRLQRAVSDLLEARARLTEAAANTAIIANFARSLFGPR